MLKRIFGASSVDGARLFAKAKQAIFAVRYSEPLRRRPQQCDAPTLSTAEDFVSAIAIRAR